MTLNERFRKLGLTPRECEVALEILMGLSNQEIGDRLFITEKSVKFHLTRMYKKVFVRQRAEFIAKFLPQKLNEDHYHETARLLTRIQELESLLRGELPVGIK